MMLAKTIVELIGIHVPQWNERHSGYMLEPCEGLNVIYGKNGSGKSTLIAGLREFSLQYEQSPLSISSRWDTLVSTPGHLLESPRSTAESGLLRVYVRATDLWFYELANELAESFDRSLTKISVANNWFGMPRSSLVENFLQASENRDPEIDNAEIVERLAEGISDVDRGQLTSLVSGRRDTDGTTTDTSSRADDDVWKLLEVIVERLKGSWSFGPLEELKRALRQTLVDNYAGGPFEGETVADVNGRFRNYGIDLELLGDGLEPVGGLLETFALSQMLTVFVDLLIQQLEWELTEMKIDSMWLGVDDLSDPQISSLIESGSLTYASVFDDSFEIVSTFGRAVAAQIMHPVFEVSKSGERKGPWVYRLALDFRDDHIGCDELTSLRRLLERLEDISERSQDARARVVFAWLADSRIVDTLDGGSYGLSPTRTRPFLPLALSAGNVHSSPLEVMDLGNPIDFDGFVRAVLIQVMGNTEYDGVLLSGPTELGEGLDVDERVSRRLRAAFEPMVSLVRSFRIGISDCRLEFSSKAIDWAAGRAVSLVFKTDGGDMDFDRLSEAQKYWVRAAIRLVEVSFNRDARLLVADEPDSGLHERAANSVLTRLSDLGFDSVITSHSVAALRTRGAALHHLERGVDGAIQLGEVRLGDDVLAAAERLGTTPYDLLSLKRLMVLVEGAHDVVVVERLLARSSSLHLADHVLVVPMRGVKNVATAADSVLVTEFSELSVLVVVDNGREESLAAFYSQLCDKSARGASSRELTREVGEFRRATDLTLEERTLLDLVERAIHRGILSRLEIYALPTGDIVELIPPEMLGLTESWEAVREEHHQSETRLDFKTWLNDYKNVRVSVKSIGDAMDSLIEVPPALLRLLQQIELHCSDG